MTGILIAGGVFLMGIGVYAYSLAQQRKQEESVAHVAEEKLDQLLGSIHSATASLRSRMPHSAPKSDFDQALEDAMKDN